MALVLGAQLEECSTKLRGTERDVKQVLKLTSNNSYIVPAKNNIHIQLQTLTAAVCMACTPSVTPGASLYTHQTGKLIEYKP